MLSRFSHGRLCATPRTVDHQAPLSKGFSREEYWSKLPCPLPGDLPHPGIEPTSSESPAQQDSFSLSHWGSPKIKLQNQLIKQLKEAALTLQLCFLHSHDIGVDFWRYKCVHISFIAKHRVLNWLWSLKTKILCDSKIGRIREGRQTVFGSGTQVLLSVI